MGGRKLKSMKKTKRKENESDQRSITLSDRFVYGFVSLFHICSASDLCHRLSVFLGFCFSVVDLRDHRTPRHHSQPSCMLWLLHKHYKLKDDPDTFEKKKIRLTDWPSVSTWRKHTLHCSLFTVHFSFFFFLLFLQVYNLLAFLWKSNLIFVVLPRLI